MRSAAGIAPWCCSPFSVACAEVSWARCAGPISTSRRTAQAFPESVGRTPVRLATVTERPNRLFGDPVLRTSCDAVDKFDDALISLMTDLGSDCFGDCDPDLVQH